MKLGRLLRKARERSGMTQGEIARYLDVKQPVVSAWERGAAHPSLHHITVWVRVTGTDPRPIFTAALDHEPRLRLDTDALDAPALALVLALLAICPVTSPRRGEVDVITAHAANFINRYLSEEAQP